ncbi:hypothetical protein [Microbulbifer sp. 2205BS26-8]|uniref:hypothetical protein n=1 Tax=unclassified Microbulbifer TaxID=2619833 RepID=UPI00273E40B3|nr:hypothetical protein [Microbulbifer sp. 2205BS26-8]MDP5208873.1 hypothetical protein [Microbulbifer sp. 2205BS26-8]
MATNVNRFISELDGGVFEEKLAHILSDVASAVTDYDRKGEVQITLKVGKIKNSHQVQIEHTLKYKKPTNHGSISEDNATSTPMYVGTKGALSLFPEKQDQMFDKKGAINGDVTPIRNS